jgi:hypothetical protein
METVRGLREEREKRKRTGEECKKEIKCTVQSEGSVRDVGYPGTC